MLWILAVLIFILIIANTVHHPTGSEHFRRHHHHGNSSCSGHYRHKKPLYMKNELRNGQPHVHHDDQAEVETFIPATSDVPCGWMTVPRRVVPGEWGQWHWSRAIDRPLYHPDCYDLARDRCIGSPSPVNCFNHYYARCTSPYTGAGLLPY